MFGENVVLLCSILQGPEGSVLAYIAFTKEVLI